MGHRRLAAAKAAGLDEVEELRAALVELAKTKENDQ